MKVLLAAGGSAGHVEPALTLADTLIDRDPNTDVVAIGTERGIESTLVPARGYRLRTVPAIAWPRRLNRAALAAPGRIASSIRQVQAAIADEAPDVVVGFGGYVSFPAYVAARRLRIPIVVHEANARPGLADRVGARLTPWVAVNSPGVLPHSARVGMPIRRPIRELAAQSSEQRIDSKRQSRLHLGLHPDLPTLVAFGGSLGAKRINAAMAAAQQRLSDLGIQVVHIVGAGGHGLPQEWPPDRSVDQPPYIALSYLSSMHEAFAAADLVLCRSGAMTCAEVSALGLPAIYVPLPVGNGEQELNARPIVDAGGGVVILDAELDADAVVDTVGSLIRDEARRQQMGSAARESAVVDADERLADMVSAAAGLASMP